MTVVFSRENKNGNQFGKCHSRKQNLHKHRSVSKSGCCSKTASSVSLWHISGWMERPVDNTLTRNSSETEKALPVFLWHINSILFEYPEFWEEMVHTKKKITGSM